MTCKPHKRKGCEARERRQRDAVLRNLCAVFVAVAHAEQYAKTRRIVQGVIAASKAKLA